MINLRIAKILCALAWMVAGPLAAQDAVYLNEMPVAARVVVDIPGTDPDARAHQIAALERLARVVRELGGAQYSSQGANPQQRALVADYAAEANRLRNAVLTGFGPGPHSLDSPRADWMKSVQNYERSEELYAELSQRYFSQAFRTYHREAMEQLGVRMEAGRVSIDQGLRDLAGATGDQTWQSLSPKARQGAITLIVILALLCALGVYRETRPQRVVAGEPALLRIGFRKHRLERIAGVITNYSARLKTTITETTEDRTDGTRKVTRDSTTIMYEDFDLVSPEGSRHVNTSHEHVRYEDGPGELGSYAGQPMSILLVKSAPWRSKSPFVKFRQPGGEYVTVRSADAALSKLTGPAFWHYFPFAALAFVIGSSTDVLAVLYLASPNVRGFLLLVLATAVWWVLFYFVAKFQQKRFEENEVPQLRALLP